MKRDDFKLYDKRKFLKTIIEKIVVKSKDKLEHELSITFKFPYVNDKLVYKDNTDKSKGYILKDGRYSKKLRIHSLKKIEVNGREMLSDKQIFKECPEYYSVTVE